MKKQINTELRIDSYNGNAGKISQLEFYTKPSPQKWNFFRQGDNHAYVKGEISYQGNCKNTVIISSHKCNKLVNVKNAFVFVNESFVEVSPISNMKNAINKGKKKLSNQVINYNIPTVVFERENLIEKDLDDLERKLNQMYGVKTKKFSTLNSKSSNGIFHILTNDGKEYVLKFRGRNKETIEILSQIAETIPDYFPTNFRRKDNKEFTFKIGSELYGLEEFIQNISPKTRDIKYFSLLGNHIGILHKHFSDFIKNNKVAEKQLTLMSNYINESNFISLYLDLSTDRSKHKLLLIELERLIDEELVKQYSSQKQLIHGDLNYSNLIWQKDNFRIIDTETFKISNRLSEFYSPLLFKGQMERPVYVRNSLNAIVNGYNHSAEIPFSKNDTTTLPLLVKYALLKNFVIRKIRRKAEYPLDEITKNLENIKEKAR